VCIGIAAAFLFVGYKYTFAVAWNRRADQLQRQAGLAVPRDDDPAWGAEVQASLE
jgi:hypothetical protein